jgi:hypothetical protein
MTTSNSSEPVSADTVTFAASDVNTSAPEVKASGTTLPAATVESDVPDKQLSGLDSLKDQAKKMAKPGPATTGASDAPRMETPKPDFQPNWKYKAFGKEKEIDEMWRPLIKDADSEKKVKDVFTRADAFEDMKSRYEGTSNEFQGLLSEYQALDKDVKKVMTFRNNRDFDNFFQSLRISDQEVFDWVKKKIDLHEQSPDAVKAAQMQAQERQRIYEMSQENESLQQRYQTQAVQARNMQLDMVLSRQDVSSAASRFDEKSGRIGAFRDLVIDEARNYYFATGGDNGGKDLSAEEATQMVMQKFGKLLEGPQAPAEAPPIAAPTPQVQAKPVIPAINGRGTSPVKKAPKSLDDLKNLYKEIQAQGG